MRATPTPLNLYDVTAKPHAVSKWKEAAVNNPTEDMFEDPLKIKKALPDKEITPVEAPK